MTLRGLEVFQAVSKYMSITQAARALCVSQPAVSQEIKRLQDAIGAKLIERGKRGIVLTQAGIAFQKQVEPLLMQLEGMKERYASGDSQNSQAALCLGANHAFSATVLPALMIEFNRSRPDVNLSLRTGSSPEVLQALFKEKIEIAIATSRRKISGVKMVPFGCSVLTFFAPPEHRLAQRRNVQARDLLGEQLIVRENRNSHGRTSLLLRKLRGGALSPQLRRYGSPDAVKTAVKRGAGIGLLDRHLISDEIRQKHFTLIKTGLDLSATVYILHLNRKPLSPTASEFLSYLCNAKASPAAEK